MNKLCVRELDAFLMMAGNDDKKMMKYDFEKYFDPAGYLSYYWPSHTVDDEDRFILRFFFSKIDKYKEKLQGKIWLEFSGGPIIDKYFSGSKYVKEIWHSAHTTASQQNITSFFENHGQTYDWTKRLEFASELESGDAKTILNRIMKKVQRILPCDASLPNGGISEDLCPAVNILSVHSVPECITPNKTECFHFMTNIFSILRNPGDILLMSVNVECQNWQSNDEVQFPCAYVSANEVLAILRDKGFIDIEYEIFENCGVGDDVKSQMDKTLALIAFKK